MYITKLKLVGYKRLMLSYIQSFEYNPTQPLQLIIGSNGSGKSSILDELTPFPAHHSGFVKGGLKQFECTHRDCFYKLISHYEQGTGKHSFIRVANDKEEELNPGGTFAVQKELVEKEFGLTRELHELLTGVMTFTGLPTNKRRELLTKMTPVDLHYAFSIYNKVKTIHRDQQGVIKHLTKRMVSENQDLPDQSVKVALQEEVNQLTDKLTELLQLRSNGTKQTFESVDEIRFVLNQLVDRGVQLLKRPPIAPVGFTITSLEQLDDLIKEHQLNQHRIQERLEQSITQFDELNQDAQQPDLLLSEEEINALRSQRTELTEQLNNIQFSFDTLTFPTIDLPLDRQPENLLKKTVDEWLDIVHSIPNNEDGHFSLTKGNDTKQRLVQLKRLLLETDNKLNAIRRRLAQLRECESVICPSCDHNFKPGISPDDIQRLENQLEEGHTSFLFLQKEEETLKQYDETFDEYLGYVRRFKRLTEQSDSTFKPLWDICLDKKIMTTSPKRYLNEIVLWYNQMTNYIRFQQTEQQLGTVLHKLRLVDALDKTILQQVSERRLALEKTIEDCTHLNVEALRIIKELQQYRQQQLKYVELLDNMAKAITACIGSIQQNVEYHYQSAIQQEIKQAQLLLAQKQNQITTLELKDSLLADIQSQYDQAQKLYEIDGLLVKGLSPTEGLIGRYLMGFMQKVVKLINAVIAEVWTYPMEVLPSMVENDELDYRFPLSVNDGAVIAPDISRGSSSQIDIINFAFKLLIMRFLGLQDMPLYLDEFGSTFDEQHRLNLIPFINRLLELGQIQQVFFISHYATMHSAFNHADVLVLDPSNITVPEVYNQHVILQ